MTHFRAVNTTLGLACTLALAAGFAVSGGGADAVAGDTGAANRAATGDSAPDLPASYDAALAGRLGADEYGMRQYVLAFLKSGPTRSQSEEEAQRLQRAHLDNITRLAEAGKLVLAGPFLDDGEIRGIYVFDVRTVDEARALTDTDPSIQAGRLVMELHPWYGSAALGMINEVHETIARKGI